MEAALCWAPRDTSVVTYDSLSRARQWLLGVDTVPELEDDEEPEENEKPKNTAAGPNRMNKTQGKHSSGCDLDALDCLESVECKLPKLKSDHAEQSESKLDRFVPQHGQGTAMITGARFGDQASGK